MQINSRTSVGKTFLNKSLTVKMSATDIFNTANDDWIVAYYIQCGFMLWQHNAQI
ncbi:MAG: hypothetical protein ACI30M_07935 [Muribaculaceae bacterium]